MSHTYILDSQKYAATARRAVAEGCVLLENKEQALPIREGEKVAVYGRFGYEYYKSGTGSGGLVNTEYVVGITDGLKNAAEIQVVEAVEKIYRDWILEHPYDEGHGWGTIPWSQEEMRPTEALFDAGKEADIALVVIGRTAGEDQDNNTNEGSYYLTECEKDLICEVCAHHARTAVLLNVGNIIDMSWLQEAHPQAVMYVWQGGQEGGNGVADVLTGKVNACGKLTDTIAKELGDHLADQNFGDEKKNIYQEDIYVGYRYFETFAKEKVLYPFGYGLSYTEFAVRATELNAEKDKLTVRVEVENTGDRKGKEVVQIYVGAPQGRLGKAEKVLAGFHKTKELEPGEKETVTIEIPKHVYASYDDHQDSQTYACFILEKGNYKIYVGNNVRDAKAELAYDQEEVVIERLSSALGAREEYERYCMKDGVLAKERVERQRAVILPETPEEIAYTGDKGYKLRDVMEGKISEEVFLAQLTDQDLIHLFRGEGMCSRKVTPGTAGAFGGITDELQAFGIPAACCADGPSGIRMDCGTKAFSMPIGTLLGCTFNLELVEELFNYVGAELRANRIDTLLGPGMNIHRHPLNGRNFEYFSEDPYVTGKMGSAQLKGMEEYRVTGTIKHFCANNQEKKRTEVEAVISERALREIYLKGFEMAVKEGKARSIMTTYGPINGVWTAGNYELCTEILRKQWGYTGILMTDWWAVANWEGEAPAKENHSAMIMAQNDIYMCCDNAKLEQDDIEEAFAQGRITRGQLQRNARNILRFVMGSLAMQYECGKISQEEIDSQKKGEDEIDIRTLTFYEEKEDENGDLVVVIPGSDEIKKKGQEEMVGMQILESHHFEMEIEIQSELGELAQLPVSVYIDNIFRGTFSFQGTNGGTATKVMEVGYMLGQTHYIKLNYGATGIRVVRMRLRKVQA